MKQTAIRTAVIGCGYLGKFHAQKYAALDSSNLKYIVDTNATAAKAMATELGCKFATDYRQILDRVDALSIATPTVSHHLIAKDCLNAGLHVLVEKPITTSVAEATELIAIAKRQNKVLQVGHLERFNPAILGMQQLLEQPQFIEAHRLAPYKLRATDVNVVLDLMIHDIDIILSIVKSDVVNIAAKGTAVLSDNSTDICNVRLEFANGCVANVTASRISVRNERKMRIFQQRACLSVDFQNRVLQHFYPADDAATTEVPNIITDQKNYANGDALLAQIESFLDAISHNSSPIVSGEDGRRALEVAIQISQQVMQ